MVNIIVTVILCVIVGSAGVYIHKSRKRGVKCIGCPDANVCAARSQAENTSGCGGCSGGCQGCSGGCASR